MPPKPSWIKRIPQIQATLDRLEVPVLDRSALERLFGVSRRRAVTLAHRMGGRRYGGALLVERQRVRAFLGDRTVATARALELVRQARLRDVIAEAQRDLAARRVKIPVPASAAERRIGDLPATIRLAPGELRVNFASAQDLLAQLFVLSQVIGRDYVAFEDLASGASTTPRQR